jgi:hypothetical protein
MAELSLSTRGHGCGKAGRRPPDPELGARRADFLVELFLVEVMALVQK